MRWVRYAMLVCVVVTVVIGCSRGMRSGDVDDLRARHERLTAALNNDMLEWHGAIFGLWTQLRPDRDTSAAKMLKEAGYPAVPALIEVLDEPERFAIAHVLLTWIVKGSWLVEKEEENSAGFHHGMSVRLGRDGQGEYLAADGPKLKQRWEAWLRNFTRHSTLEAALRERPRELEPAAAAISNGMLFWYPEPLWPAFVGDSTAVSELGSAGYSAVPALIDALDDPDRFAIAHVLLSSVDHESGENTATLFNGMTVNVMEYGKATYDALERGILKERWEAWWLNLHIEAGADRLPNFVKK